MTDFPRYPNVPMLPEQQVRYRELQSRPQPQWPSFAEQQAQAAALQERLAASRQKLEATGTIQPQQQGDPEAALQAALDQILGPAGQPPAPPAPSEPQQAQQWSPPWYMHQVATEEWTNPGPAPEAMYQRWDQIGQRQGVDQSGNPISFGPQRWEAPLNETLQGPVNTFAQGVTLGGGDELAGLGAGARAAMSGGDFGQGYQQGQQQQQQILDDYRQRSPMTAAGLEIAGTMLPSVMVPGAAWQRGAPLAGNLARTGAAGGALGGVSTALNGGSPADIAVGTGVGAGLGAGIPAAGAALMRGVRSIAQGVGSLANRATTPTTAAVGDASKAAFRAADQTGAVIAPNVVQSAGNVLDSVLQGANLDAAAHPATARALSQIQARLTNATSNGGLRFEDIANLRTIISDAVAGAEGPDRRVATILSREFNRFLDGLTPQDIVSGGNIDDAMAAYRSGQDLWGRYLRSAELDEMMRVAQANPSSFEQGLINEFRKLYRDPERWARYTPDEQEAIRTVINGGPVGSVLRLFGKAAPTGIVSAGLGSGAGLAVGGPMGAAAVPAIGMGSKLIADALTRGSAGRVSELVRGGGGGNIISPRVQEIVNALTSGAGRAGAAAGSDDLSAAVNSGMANRGILDALLSGAPVRSVPTFRFSQ